MEKNELLTLVLSELTELTRPIEETVKEILESCKGKSILRIRYSTNDCAIRVTTEPSNLWAQGKCQNLIASTKFWKFILQGVIPMWQKWAKAAKRKLEQTAMERKARIAMNHEISLHRKIPAIFDSRTPQSDIGKLQI